ncbi:hypothetical protein OFL98_30400, partial [Escherichia coli]|nr:hypothetical protein [Escherichia coli]
SNILINYTAVINLTSNNTPAVITATATVKSSTPAANNSDKFSKDSNIEESEEEEEEDEIPSYIRRLQSQK